MRRLRTLAGTMVVAPTLVLASVADAKPRSKATLRVIPESTGAQLIASPRAKRIKPLVTPLMARGKDKLLQRRAESARVWSKSSLAEAAAAKKATAAAKSKTRSASAGGKAMRDTPTGGDKLMGLGAKDRR